MYAKKSLGQNFLRSERALNAIVEAGKLSKDDTVLEIGPGKGALTEKLLACSSQLTAVEKDDDLYKELQTKFQKEINDGKLNLINGDVLDFDPATLQATSYKLIANIPYNITGAIFKKFLEAEKQPERMVLLVQKEVAERIVAKKEKPFDSHRQSSGQAAQGKESILSISVKAYGKPIYIETVKAGSFAPAPKVDSAIIAIEGISKEFFSGFSEEEFFKVLRAGFASKRKKLSSNLSKIFAKERVSEVFSDIGLDENARAEDLGMKIWGEIAKRLTA